MSRQEGESLLEAQQHDEAVALVGARRDYQERVEKEQALLDAIKAKTTVRHAAYMTLLATGSAMYEAGAFVGNAVRNNPVKAVVQIGMLFGLVASELTGVFDKNPSSAAKDAEVMGQDVNNMARTQAAKYTGALVAAGATGLFLGRVNAHYDRRLLEEESSRQAPSVS